MAVKDARPHRQSAKADNGRTSIELLRRDCDGVERRSTLPIDCAGPSAIWLVLPPVIDPPLEGPLLELRDLNDGTVILRLCQRLPIATIEMIMSKLTAIA